MDNEISSLLARYENGKISRRALVHGMSALAAASAGTCLAAAPGLKVDSINHVSLLVSDLQKSADFYKRVLGAPVEQRGVEMIATFGSNRLVMRVGKPAGTVDHVGLGVETFDEAALTAELKRRGVTASVGARPGPGYHFLDPDGFPIQLQASRE